MQPTLLPRPCISVYTASIQCSHAGKPVGRTGRAQASHGRASATTTPTRNRCSGRCRRSPAERQYRPEYPRKPFASKYQACQWVASFVDWYNHQHRPSGIIFVTPQQRHDGQAVEISRHRAVVYERTRQLNPKRWSRSTRCWRQPEWSGSISHQMSSMNQGSYR